MGFIALVICRSSAFYLMWILKMICLTVIRFYPVFESQKIKKVNKHIRILIDIQCDKYNEIIDTAKKKKKDLAAGSKGE